MKRLFCASALAIAVGAAHASPVYHPPGPNLTYGEVSNGQTVMSDIANPAASAVDLEHNGSHVQFGVISSIGIGVEFGQVDNIFDVVDQKAKAYSSGLAVTIPTLTGNPVADATAITNAITVPVADLDDVLRVVEADGYGKAFGSLNLPLMPLVVGNEFLGGALVLDINASATGKVNELHDGIDLILDPVAIATQLSGGATVLDLGEVSLDLTSQTLTVDNDTLLLTRAAVIGEFALGYSRQMLKNEQGGLFAGLRAKYYRVGLSRVDTRLGSVTDAEQVFRDIADATFHESSGLGLDLGVLWVAEHYRVGATATNLNEPAFDYATDTPAQLVARGYTTGSAPYNFLRQKQSFVMERQLKLEGALYTTSRNWVINLGLDANAVPDPFGDDYQWATVSGAYATDSWLIPGFRLGLRKNLAGTELSYATLGATLFKVFNLDLAMSLDSVTIDGTTVPRGAMANLGLELTF